MKVLIIDFESDGLDLALRAQDAGHSVRYWLPPEAGPYGRGMVEKVKEWEPSMNWAELIVVANNNQLENELEPFFTSGYPLFATNKKSAELELDRGKGQEILKRYGIPTLPYTVVGSPEEAIEFLLKKGKPYAMKPWGGESDKAMTCVPRDLDEALYTVLRWKQKGLFKGQLMLQEMVEGVEIGISAFFGPGGFTEAKEESFEHKKFFPDDLGCNTGEMGTVIRHVRESKLFDLLLEPLEDYLHLCNFVGDVSVNAMVADGEPWPLEFTMRLGWPDFCIRQAVIKSDPVEWMADLRYGRDSLRTSTDIAVGVLMCHGDFPTEHDDPSEWAGFPISGFSSRDERNIHWQQVMDGKMPVAKGRKWENVSATVTAGQYVCIVTGTGTDVEMARTSAYAIADNLRWPSNVMYRTDIGCRLEEQLPILQKSGYAKGMKYG